MDTVSYENLKAEQRARWGALSESRIFSLWQEKLRDALDSKDLKHTDLPNMIMDQLGRRKENAYSSSTARNWLFGEQPKKINTLLLLVKTVLKADIFPTKSAAFEWVNLLDWDEDSLVEFQTILFGGVIAAGIRTDMPELPPKYIKMKGEESIFMLIRRDDYHGFFIHGPRGVGKTVFLASLARQLERDFWYGVFWVAGRDLTAEATLDQLLAASVGEKQDVSEQSLEEKIKIWTDWVEALPDKVLLILDDIRIEVLSVLFPLSKKIKYLISTVDIEKTTDAISSINENELLDTFQLEGLAKSDFLERASEMFSAYPDVYKQVVRMWHQTDGYPVPILDTFKKAKDSNEEKTFLAYPEAVIEIHRTARLALSTLSEQDKNLLIRLACYSADKGFELKFSFLHLSTTAEGIAEIWEMDEDITKIIIARLLRLGHLIASDAYSYRPLNFYVAACVLAKKLKRDPYRFLLSEDG